MANVKLFVEDVRSAWMFVFPKSRCYVGISGECAMFAGYLAKDKSECANGIIENDPLRYRGWFNMMAPDVYKEEDASMFVKPAANSFNVYGSAKMRRKSIKAPDRAALVKRFMEVRDFIRANKDNMKNVCFDINEKV